MITALKKQLKTAILVLCSLTIMSGLFYPAIVTILAQLYFPWQANGSIITLNNKPIGSLLIGQYIDNPAYFWGRPSATPDFPYNAAYSSGSNLGPTNPVLVETIKTRIAYLKKSDPNKSNFIPVGLMTASGSGLDPEISPMIALYQIPRIANKRHIPEQEIRELIARLTLPCTFNLFGKPRINVLQLNLALDQLTRSRHARQASKP